jgi:hypothetical protein
LLLCNHHCIDGYFSDLILANEEENSSISAFAERLKFENSNGALMQELLPQMMALCEALEHNPNESVISRALRTAINHDVFGNGVECPFDRKISSVFALQPARISPTEVVILPEKKRGFLPIFIHQELSNHAPVRRPDLSVNPL